MRKVGSQGLIFCLWFRRPHKSVVFLAHLKISVGTFDINERKKFFEIAKVIKTIILPSTVRRLICQTFKKF